MTTPDPRPRPRLAVVLSHPVQYYAPWFRQLAAGGELHLRVFYLWDFGVTEQRDEGFQQPVRWDVDLLGGYESELVPNRSARPGTRHFNGLDNPALVDRLAAWRPDAVLVFGYRYRSHLRLLLAARRRRWPLIFRGDSHLLGEIRPPLFKRLALGWVLRRFQAFTYVGEANRQYLRAFGAPDGRLHFAPHAVEAERFSWTAENAAAAAAQRRELGIPEHGRVLLFCGKFEPKKRPDLLVRAFRAANVSGAHLVLAGDGALRGALEEATRRDAHLHLLPFANQQAMPARYLVGDVFVLPSQGRSETWGLAVNEAMHARRPVIVSNVVGCHLDLVDPGTTGWVFSAGDEAALTRAISSALEASPDQLRRMGDAAAARAASYSYAAATAGLRAAIRQVLARPEAA